jgi:hypothetical protein
VYTSHFCDASGEHLTFLYGKYLTSSTEALEAMFRPLAPIAGVRFADWLAVRGVVVGLSAHNICTFDGYQRQEQI